MRVLISGWVCARRVVQPFWAQTPVRDNSYQRVRRFRLGTHPSRPLKPRAHLDQVGPVRAVQPVVVIVSNGVPHVHVAPMVHPHLRQAHQAPVPILWSMVFLLLRVQLRASRDF